jgi:hypothetical protein
MPRTIEYYIAELNTASAYYSFGSPMPGRSFTATGGYRFGFQGQEKDDEVYGEGNLNTAEFWEYDTRLGRRWNVDPVVKPWESGYAVMGNSPIALCDPLGLDAKGGGQDPGRSTYDPENGGCIPPDEQGGQNGSVPPSENGSIEGEKKTTHNKEHGLGGIHKVPYNWRWSKNTWISQDNYLKNVIVPMAQDLANWRKGESDGNQYFKFVSQPISNDVYNCVEYTADYISANPEYTGIGSFMPIWGPANQASLDLGVGNYGKAALQLALGVSDCFLIGSLLDLSFRGAFGKTFLTWRGYRGFYGDIGLASFGQNSHHSFFYLNGKRDATKYGFGWSLVNNPLNLTPITGGKWFGLTLSRQDVHILLHNNTRRQGPNAGLNLSNDYLFKLYYGTNSIVKNMMLNSLGRTF